MSHYVFTKHRQAGLMYVVVRRHDPGPLWTAKIPAMQWYMDRIGNRCIEQENGCRLWQGAKSQRGYGRIKIGGRLALAHRIVAYSMGQISDIFDDMVIVLHTCDTPSCCNPQHLAVGTQADNMQDCARKGRLAAQKTKRQRCV